MPETIVTSQRNGIMRLWLPNSSVKAVDVALDCHDGLFSATKSETQTIHDSPRKVVENNANDKVSSLDPSNSINIVEGDSGDDSKDAISTVCHSSEGNARYSELRLDECQSLQIFKFATSAEIIASFELTRSRSVLGNNGSNNHQVWRSEGGALLPREYFACERNPGIQECLLLSDNEREAAGLKEEKKSKRPVTVAVTGAGGFIASWIVKLLLQRGFFVRGTLRNIDDESTAHLRSLEGASERLELLKADILHPPSLVAVVEGCEGVFHTACPVPPAISDPEAQMLRPAVEGTLNVLRACVQARVKRVIMTSSIGAVYMNPSASPDQVVDERCWSDENYLKDRKEWYCLAKLMAERAAWDYARAHNLDLVTLCPAVTLGTMLQPHVNQSSIHILKYLNGSTKTYANLCQAYVDVEDAAEAHILAFVTRSASGRFLCCKWTRHRSEVVSALACLYPYYPIPTRCKEEGQPKKLPIRFCTQKAEQLGVQFTSFDDTLRRTVSSLQAKGSLQNTPALSQHEP